MVWSSLWSFSLRSLHTFSDDFKKEVFLMNRPTLYRWGVVSDTLFLFLNLKVHSQTGMCDCYNYEIQVACVC